MVKVPVSVKYNETQFQGVPSRFNFNTTNVKNMHLHSSVIIIIFVLYEKKV